MSGELRIRWCGNPRRSRELADFFASNVDPSYISHSELQGPRALSTTEWRQPLVKYLREEIEPRLAKTKKTPKPGRNSKPILVAEDGMGLVALSFVTFDSKWVPHAIIEDLVVKPAERSKGVGKTVMDWIMNEARARNIHRLMLESGLENHDAHRFFEREGFITCSKVMMREF